MAYPLPSLDFSLWHQHGLFFLLGSFVVAAISDLKYLGAQKEFVHVWALAAAALLAIDAYFKLYAGPIDQISFGAKVAIILAFVAVSNMRTGVLFSIAWGDIFAAVAALALFPWAYGLAFVALMKVLDLLMRPALRAFGRGDAYPFMPVVVAAMLVVLPIIHLLAPGGLALDLASLPQFGLSLLLGSFFVAAISDAKYMGAQKEFGEFWAGILVLALAGTAYIDWQRGALVAIGIKCAMLLGFIVLSNTRVGVLFALAWGDILAVGAAVALLPWLQGLVLLVALKLLDLAMRPALLRGFGRGDAYPFMPVVVGASLAALAFAYVAAPVLPPLPF